MAKTPLKAEPPRFAIDPATGAYLDRQTGKEIRQDERDPGYAAVKTYLEQGGEIESLPPPPLPISQRVLALRLHERGISIEALEAALAKADPLLLIDWRFPESTDVASYGAIAKVIEAEFGIAPSQLWD